MTAAAAAAPPAPAVRRRTRSLHLAAAIDVPDRYEVASYGELARLAEGGALDFVTLDGAADADPLAVLTAVAAETGRIGLVPAVPVTRAGPRGVAAAVGALDSASRGRAGWTPRAVPEPVPESASGPASGRRSGPASGRRSESRAGGTADLRSGPRSALTPKARAEAMWRETAAVAEAVAREWDGGAPGPRVRQGRPVTAVDATEPAARAVAARYADLAFVRAAGPETAGLVRDELRRLAVGAGRDPDRLLVLAELSVDLGGGEIGPEPGAEITLVPDGAGGVLFCGGPVDLAELIAAWQQAGAVDGFRVRPVEPRRDLERFVNGTTALLQHRGLFRSFHPGATLREHLGLHRPLPDLR
ncbi:FMNH2-dependent monooxygenase [Streptomyces sp. NPDC093221]|uniref:FMNH2-dependent monooxygenase n=1 Tax=unclassified Streptomyces TaxID=2593676 RepID=UPI003828AE85